MASANDLRIPSTMFSTTNVNPTFGTFSIQASTSKVAWIFVAQEAAVVTALGFRYGARTGTPPIQQISLQGVDATGLPDGTIQGGGSPASNTFTPPATTAWDGTWQWITLLNTFTLVKGTAYSIVVEYSSGTINSSNASSYTNNVSDLAPKIGPPYALTNTAGTWTKISSGTADPLFGYQSASRSYGLIMQNYLADAIGTNNNRIAWKFNFPTTWFNTFQLTGIRVDTSTPAATLNWKFGIWNAAGTALASVQLDGDITTSAASSNRMVDAYFTSLVTLNAGTDYYAGLERIDGACSVWYVQVAANADLSAYPFGITSYYSAWNGSTWTDTNTKRPLIELVFADITAPSGGLLVHPGMGGGMHG